MKPDLSSDPYSTPKEMCDPATYFLLRAIKLLAYNTYKERAIFFPPYQLLEFICQFKVAFIKAEVGVTLKWERIKKLIL